MALAVFSMKGQLLDDFSDGDLNNDPPWLGQTAVFTVENQELRLLDTSPLANNTAYLYLPAATSAGVPTVWEWYARLDFSPSSGNYAKIYLQADQPDLTGDQHGYYLRIGGVSGADDALELFRQDGGSTELLISGTPGALGAQPAVSRIRVERNAEGVWSLYADYSGGNGLQFQGSAADLTYPYGQFAGLVCFYTSTRNDDFYFDDVSVDPLYVDQSPPVLIQVTAMDSVTVDLGFDEPLEEYSATDPANFFISGGIGQPGEAVWDPGTPETVSLMLAQALQPLAPYTLEVQGVADVAGNESALQTGTFTWVKTDAADRYDVLFTEIMADPSPAVALPEVEYLELHNRTGKTIQLEGWTLSDGGAPAFFPARLLLPGRFLLVCREGEEVLLAPYGEVLGLADFPGLNNGGDRLSLSDEEGERIDLVDYSADWYGESDKDDGGWSLELINPLSPCEGAGNWRASEDLLGGTPGAVNSSWEPAPDLSGPVPVHLFPESPNTGTLTFSEAMGFVEPGFFSVSQGISVEYAQGSSIDPREVELAWSPALEPETVYEMSFRAQLTDCAGNAIDTSLHVKFGIPEPVAPGDIAINEILFQPETGGEEFIELYNLSGKVLNAGDLIVGNIQGGSDSIAPVEGDRLFFPGEHLVLCERPSGLVARYESADGLRIHATDLPVLPDQGGNVTLYVEGDPGEALVIDAVDYSPEWHHVLLHTTRGVSLERIDPAGPSRSAGNWHSAAAAAGYATPTAENSQFFPLETGSNAFSLPYKTFSPDGDGREDFLLLQYRLESAGWTASVRVFDAMGRQVKEIARNELLAADGVFRWDGDDQNGGKARMGIYVLWIQLAHPGGDVREEKLACVLAGKI